MPPTHERLRRPARANEISRLGCGSRKRLKFLAGFETHSLARRDVHLLARARIAADARLARLHVEDAKAAKFDAASVTQRVLHRLENGFNRLLGLGSGNVGFLNDGVD